MTIGPWRTTIARKASSEESASPSRNVTSSSSSLELLQVAETDPDIHEWSVFAIERLPWSFSLITRVQFSLRGAIRRDGYKYLGDFLPTVMVDLEAVRT